MHAHSPLVAVSCPGVAADTSGWKFYDEDGFTVRLPPHYEQQAARGIDSYVGEWRSGEAIVRYDLGIYSSTLEGEMDEFSKRIVCHASDSSNAPRIIVYRENGRGMLVAYWPEPTESPIGRIHLSLSGTLSSADSVVTTRQMASSKRILSELLAIIESVRFTGRYR